MNSLKTLWTDYHQAVWLDNIQRSLVEEGGLAALIHDDGIRGVTSNPSIFRNAIAGTAEYDSQVKRLLEETPGISVEEVYEALVIQDIQGAATLLLPTWEASSKTDGFVSLEVSPMLARDEQKTVEEARRLWKAVDRPNLMIKVPATAEGIGAIETLIASGINVNATLMFSLGDYEAVSGAYLRGLFSAEDPSGIASVASFFVSRVDTAVDRQLEEIGSPEALELRGKAAIANAAAAYARFQEIFHGRDFAPLLDRGACVQRPLWASTSTKNPGYPDVLYVEELIGRETVNTIPTATLGAFRDHGAPRDSLEEWMERAPEILGKLKDLGIDMDDVTRRLQDEGVAAFARAFDELLDSLRKKIAEDRA